MVVVLLLLFGLYWTGLHCMFVCLPFGVVLSARESVCVCERQNLLCHLYMM